jgi:type IV secretion system protein VirB4
MHDLMGMSISSKLPYSNLVSDNTVITYARDLTQTIKLQGVPFETISNEDLNNLTSQWLYTLNNAFRSGKVSFWSHIVRKQVRFDASKVQYDNPVSAEFARQYNEKVSKEDKFVNELYLSPVVRAASTFLDKQALRLSRKNTKEMHQLYLDSEEMMNKVSEVLMSGLRKYHPKKLGVYTDDEGVVCSELAEFYSSLLNHEDRKIPRARANVSDFIQRNDLNFGAEIFEIERNGHTEFGAVLSLHAPYEPDQISVRCLEGLLSAPMEFTLSQSVTIVPFDKADDMLKRQYNNIKSTTNNSIELANIQESREKLQAGQFSMLDHEFVLVVYANDIRQLNKNINEITAVLDKKKLSTTRLKQGVMKNSFFNILPGNFMQKRNRALPIRDYAFTMFFPMHNHPTGNANGSQWGLPIAMLETSSNTPYFFNYHVSRDRLAEQGINLEYDEDAERDHKKELGNYKIVGRSGSGKTVIKVGLRLLAKKAALTGGTRLQTYSFDYEYGEEIAIRAMGGQYFRIKAGESTGVNLFSLPNNEESIALIHSIMKWCAQQDGTYKLRAKDEEDLFKNIRRVYKITDKRLQTFGAVRAYLSDKSEDSLYTQLGRWCDGGPYAWLLDNDVDKFDLSKAHDFGFDMTEILDMPEARTPLLTYLTHKISLYASGLPHIIDIAEAWKALSDPFMELFIREKGKVIRRLNGIIGLDTQDPEELSKSKFSASLNTQFPTLIVLPNSSAKTEDYMDGLGLTPREFKLIKETPEGTGQFLVKKGNESVMVKMDLSGMNNLLSVISGSADNVNIMHEVMEEVGEDPSVWLPIFYQRRV